jgi:hypothetical protein
MAEPSSTDGYPPEVLHYLADRIFLAEAVIHISHSDLNGRFTRFFNVTSLSSAIGKTVDDLFSAGDSKNGDLSGLHTLTQEAIKSGSIQKARLRLRVKAGSVVKWFDVTVSPRRDPSQNNAIVGASAVFIDLGSATETEALELQLRTRITELEELNRTLLSAKEIAESARKAAEFIGQAKADFLAMMSQ